MRYLFIGLFVAALVTPAMGAYTIANVAVQDDFEAYASGTDLKNCTPIWTGAGPENTVLNNTGDNAVRMKGGSGNTSNSTSYTAANYAPAMGDGNIQVMQFTVQKDVALNNDGNHAYISMLEASGNAFPYWYGGGVIGIRARLGSNVSTYQDLSDGAVHTCQTTYNPANGLCEWFFDGTSVLTLTIDAGLCAERMELYDQKNLQDWLWVDDMVMGTTPEPATLGLLLLGLPLLRRRR